MKKKTIMLIFFMVGLVIFTTALSMPFKLPFHAKEDLPVGIISAKYTEVISKGKLKHKDVKIVIFDMSEGKPENIKDMKVKYTILAKECVFIYGKEKQEKAPNKKDVFAHPSSGK